MSQYFLCCTGVDNRWRLIPPFVVGWERRKKEERGGETKGTVSKSKKEHNRKNNRINNKRNNKRNCIEKETIEKWKKKKTNTNENKRINSLLLVSQCLVFVPVPNTLPQRKDFRSRY